jgi:hypothetical protein
MAVAMIYFVGYFRPLPVLVWMIVIIVDKELGKPQKD